MAYPHHQSRKDFLEMVGENHFQTVLPFHNNRTEVSLGRKSRRNVLSSYVKKAERGSEIIPNPLRLFLFSDILVRTEEQ